MDDSTNPKDPGPVGWMPAPASYPVPGQPGRIGYWSGHYYAVRRDRDGLDGNWCEAVYLYFDGKYSVLALGDRERRRLEDFTHWWGPLPVPQRPADLPEE